ncbi:MAG: DUF4974 domain-containing protein [Bacteroides sp.]|nr:DUF4974 domain-containing protein [Bacteroides sp.]
MEAEKNRTEEFIARIKLNKQVEAEMEHLRFGILESVHRRIEAKQSQVRRQRTTWMAAASIALLVGLSAGLMWLLQSGPAQPRLVELTCPLGVKSTLTLPDGTSVLMNGGTRLSYQAEEFGEEERRVWIDGEAFFDVVRNEEAPFIVHGGSTQVRVLGTRFNVESYESDECVKVTLESGRVSMTVDNVAGECLLAPGQQAVYNKQAHKLQRHTADVSEALAWCNDKMVFTDTPLDEIARKLERRFNIRIEIQTEALKQVRYNGAFTANDNWQRILSMLAMMDSRIEYQETNDVIIIRQKE